MFKLDPFYNFEEKGVDLPNCMFKMDKVIGSMGVLLPGQNGSDELSKLQALEQRQRRILEELSKMESQVESLETKFGVQPANQSASQSVNQLANTYETKTPERVKGPAVVGDVIHDVVIYANPASPPYSLIYLYKSLQMQYSCRTAIHIHSSVKSVPDKLMNCLGNGVRIERPKAQIALTLIWKDVTHGPQLRVSPSSQTPINGESNIARYLARLLQPSYEEDLHLACLADHWLDLASFSLIGGNSKERAAAVRSLNAHLGKKSWLVGDEASFVDAVVYSALSQTGQRSGATGNVQNWLKACESQDRFEQIRTLFAD